MIDNSQKAKPLFSDGLGGLTGNPDINYRKMYYPDS